LKPTPRTPSARFSRNTRPSKPAAGSESKGSRPAKNPLGKVFPKTDDAKTVLRALLDACGRSGIGILGNTCVDALDTDDPNAS
jgi:predicted flavoprotein YhiN